MVGFDIASLLDFEPATHLCVRCRALLHIPSGTGTTEPWQCPVCGLAFVSQAPTLGSTMVGSVGFATDVGQYLSLHGLQVRYDNLVSHASRLAEVAAHLNDPEKPPVASLYAVLMSARHFVHFVTFGISAQLIGLLRAVSMYGVNVSGVAAKVSPSEKKELIDRADEFPGLEVRIDQGDAGDDLVHLKLIVIDGLLAIKGSANLTLEAWRKSRTRRELIETVTSVGDVQRLNNNYFSIHWERLANEPSQAVHLASAWTAGNGLQVVSSSPVIRAF